MASKRKATVLASCFRQGSKTANIPNAGTTSTTTTEVNPSTRETTNKKNPYSQLATDDDEDGIMNPLIQMFPMMTFQWTIQMMKKPRGRRRERR